MARAKGPPLDPRAAMAAKRRKPSTIFAAGDMVAGRYHETAGLQATSRRAHALANRVGAIAERLHLRRPVEGTKAGTRWAAAALQGWCVLPSHS